MNKKPVFLKLILVLLFLGLEMYYSREFVGLIFLTLVFGGFFLWNTVYCIRYSLIFILSAILLIPAALVLHKHFYNWRNVARLPILTQLADTVENISLNSKGEMLYKELKPFSDQMDRQSIQFTIEIQSSDGNHLFRSKNSSHGLNKNSQTATSKKGHVTVTYEQPTWSYWEWDWQWPLDWDGTYFRYWRALLKADVILATPPKYLDVLMVHVVLLLMIIVLYLYVIFERNFKRSAYLLNQLHVIIEAKKVN